VPELSADALMSPAHAGHPSAQEPVEEVVFEWHGIVEHERGQTECCRRSIEVTNLVDDKHRVIEDVVASVSTVLHGWDGWDVMVLVTITPPALH
jgi:hypothetical protein